MLGNGCLTMSILLAWQYLAGSCITEGCPAGESPAVSLKSVLSAGSQKVPEALNLKVQQRPSIGQRSYILCLLKLDAGKRDFLILCFSS